MLRVITTITLLVPFAAACGITEPRKSPVDVSSLEEAWNGNNDPLRLADDYVVRLAALPRSGETARKPWTDTYWPSYKGGLAQRWNDPSAPDSFTYRLHDADEVAGMDEAALKKLSPAEKFDVFNGRYDYPLVSEERSRTSPDDESWFGLCHGWAPASYTFEEPEPVTVRSPAGIDVPFGSSDVKALLTYVQQYGTGTRFLGERCNSDLPGDDNDSECRDVNAGSFHIVLTNQIGLLGLPFVAEVNRGLQVWNQPVFAFTTEVVSERDGASPGAATGTVKEVTVRTVMKYVHEIGPTWEALPYDENPQQATTKVYQYRLELGQQGAIIGGEWLARDRPDFLWTQRAPEMRGYFKTLKGIYEASTRD